MTPSKSSRDSGPFIALAPHCALKRLEEPSLFDIKGDQLYDLDEDGFAYLASCPPAATAGEDEETEKFLRFCRTEGLVKESALCRPLNPPSVSSRPSLRYLLVHITDRCNLKCRHCFLGKQEGRELTKGQVMALADEFAEMQGLRFIVSGGEPLLHRDFDEINERLADYPFRTILLTNGSLIDEAKAESLRFHEVQVSIDGIEESHDLLRGKGSFEKALGALRLLGESPADISVATMVHAANLDHFGKLREMLLRFSLKSWSVDVPCLAGFMAQNRELDLLPEKSAPLMDYSFGGGHYGSSGEYACGGHLAAVMADGSICKCSHYKDKPAGPIEEGLAAAWKKMDRFRLGELRCRCTHIESCRGGCRYRAETFSDLYGPDPVKCTSLDVPVGGDLS